MIIQNKTGRLLLVLLTLTLLVPMAGCGGSNRGQSTNQEGKLTGTITLSGAWALYPMVVRWAEEFQKLHPDVQFDISAGGAGKGMADALGDAVDIGMVSRTIYQEEIDKGAFWISAVKDAVFPAVNENNPVWADLHQRGISQQVFTDIYITGKVTTWGQVIGRPEVTDPIHVFTRSDACGAAATWAEFLGGQQEDLAGIAVYGDPGLLDAVVKDPLGIGYNNLNYVYDMESGEPVTGARVVPIDVNNNGQVDPGEIYNTKDQAVDAVASDQYPSPPARDLNLVTLGKPTGLVAEFLRWVLIEGQAYVAEVGYISLPQAKLEAELSKLD